MKFSLALLFALTAGALTLQTAPALVASKIAMPSGQLPMRAIKGFPENVLRTDFIVTLPMR